MGINTTLSVESTRDLGPQFWDNPNRMSGQDGAYSIPLDDGALWFFGDTLIGERPVDEPMPHGPELREYEGFERMPFNCGLVCRDETGAGGLEDFEYVTDDEGEIRQLVELLPHEDDDIRPWCLDGCVVDGTVYLYYVNVRMLEGNDENFEVGFELVGSGLAYGSPDDFEFTRIEHDEGSTMLWDKRPDADEVDPHLGSAVLADPDADEVYVYGATSTNAPYDACCVGRVAKDDIRDVEAYEYYTGDGWSERRGDAVPIFDGMPNEMSVSYNEHLGEYLSVYSLDRTGQVVGRTAPDPWGPWSPPAILWSVDPVHDRLPSDIPTYAGKEHPELATDAGQTIYLTYVDFHEYFPHLVEVTLE